MKGSDFIFNGINYLYYDLNRITISKGGSYIESPKWLKDKKCTMNQKNTDNKLSYYRGEDCMKRFCRDLKDHATKIIDFKKKTMIPLTKEEEDNYNKENICHICKKEFNNDKVRDHCHFTGKYRGPAHNTYNLRYKTRKNIPVIFHNGSTYDYHFIIKELAREFDGNFECLGENTE